MKQDEMHLRNAVQALQADEPEAEQMAASAHRVADKLGIDAVYESTVVAITSCDDVQHLFGAYRAGTLPQARALLIEAHLRDCSGCLRRFKGGSGVVLDWSAPKPRRVIAWHPQTAAWALASAAALLAASLFVYRAFWQVPPGVRAEVQSIDGTAYRISDKGDHQLSPGEMLGE
ncbi:MAG TPA: zf-HC2 domain-containing protein, partial [Terracidiphilus sp.]|nr:zf-HC2 domain-containing protein [Terracidiphilus sp.]